MIIGLTGVIASGKSTVISILKENGFKVLDCDLIVHDLYQNNTELINKIQKEFNCVNNNIINRKKLGEIIFNDSVKRDKLNKIVHPYVFDEIKKNIDDNIIIDVPLLFETGFNKYVDKVVTIYTKKDILISRLMIRDNINYEYAIKKINSQMDIEEKVKLSDYIIDNNSSIEDLKNNVDNFIKEINYGKCTN